MASVESRVKELAADDEPGPGDTVFKIIRRFFVKSAAWLGIYVLGYYGFSIAWLLTPLLLTVYRQQWKKERDFRLSAARQAALTNEKAMIESRIKVEDLPSWVFFPDKERAEWINSIIQQLWPNVGHYTRKVIAESVEPAVKVALEGYGLGNFKFEKVVLGQIPPRITGIKVYDKNTNRNEIIMDLDLVFASDCDIKINLKGMKAKISDLSLRGLLRVVFKPLITDIPLIGGIQVYFLTTPEIDFDLGGIANALDVPGLSNIIRSVIAEQIGAFIVLPNKFTMALADGVGQKQLKCPDYAGVLRVRLIRAEKLAKKDTGVLGMGKSDPYATLSVGARKRKTPYINNTVNPEWNFVADFPIEVVRGQQLTLEVFDHDNHGDDEFLGSATVATGLVADKGQVSDMWVELEDVKTGRALLSLSWLEASNNKDDMKKMTGEDLARCMLQVYVDSCKGLIEKAKKPCPVVIMNVGAGEEQRTSEQCTQTYTVEPVFEKGFVFLVRNPDTDDLHIKVLDSAISMDSTNRNAFLGQVDITISDILRRKNMEFCPPQPFVLKGGTGTITLSVQLKTLRQSNSPNPTLDYTKNSTNDQNVTQTDKPDYNPAHKQSLRKEGSMQSTISGVTEPLLDNVNEQPAKLTGTPSIDEVLANTIDPMIRTTGNDSDMQDLMAEQDCSLRKRSNIQPTGPCGKIKLSISYDAEKEELNVTVHEARGLPGGDLPDPPDPYVKLYLLPERSKKTKRKSDFKRDTVNPNYDETFQYDDIKSYELHERQLEVSVVDRKGIFAKGSLMGRVIIGLADVEARSCVSEWYQLEEDEGDSD